MRKGLIYLLIAASIACNSDKTKFRLLDPDRTGIQFNNEIIENDSVNVLVFENVYNGGGVGIGDFNNDGLQDIYFTGNLVENKLYLNKGDLRFEDITSEAGVNGHGRWGRGASVVDINNDGLMDLYISASVKDNPAERQNLMYVNQGMNSRGIPVFKDLATEYGLNDTTHTTMASFFDYDNDGDLDVYLAVNDIIRGDYPNRFRPRMLNGEHPSTGRLYRNDWNESLKHGVFTNVSREAGILIEGYGHAVSITDINLDGWKDIYVTNDYLSNNILYQNNHDGTFTDRSDEYFKHTSANSMGVDIADMNNDGLNDIFELDMNPQDNYRKKMMLNANSYQTYQNIEYFNYQYQYVRNTLQMNMGPRLLENDSVGPPVFGELAFFSGVAETDWSWAPLLSDFDNDGLRDIIVTNGFPRDVTDHDFISFRNSAFSVATRQQLLEQIPAVKIPNYAFRNEGNLSFSNVSENWGFVTPSFSNGAAYADLDNDGDLDIVINNINDKAHVYENRGNPAKDQRNYLQIQLKGDGLNKNAIGSWVELFCQGKTQVYEQIPYRGYLSTMEMNPHFGLGEVSRIDSIKITWPDKKVQVLTNVPANQKLVVEKSGSGLGNWVQFNDKGQSLFAEVTRKLGIDFIHREQDFVDFNLQKLLPHKFSEYGPAAAAGDLDGNGLDDIVCGGSFNMVPQVLLQQADGKFKRKNLYGNMDTLLSKRQEEMGILLFDADNDRDLDIYLAYGGSEGDRNSAAFQDRLFINDGKAGFTESIDALPANLTSKSCARACDFDRDGDLDIFVAGRVDPGFYPRPVSSFILRNDSKDNLARFTDISSAVAPALDSIGLVCDAVFTDFDNDGWMDLVLIGEWMSVHFLRNDKGKFTLLDNTGIEDRSGWWTSIVSGDFDNDGDMDFVAGNLGKNSFYRADKDHPVSIVAKDFDANGSFDAIPSVYLFSTLDNKKMVEYPAHTRDDMIKQIISMRSKFQNYRSYAVSPMKDLFTEEQLKGAIHKTANFFESVYIENSGNGKFQMKPLPAIAQISSLNGMVAEDFNGDGNLDLVCNTNDYGTEVSVGRYDALNGLFLQGDGKGNFIPLSILQSGIFIPGNGKALVKFLSPSGDVQLAATQNRDSLKVFRLRKSPSTLRLNNLDVAVTKKFRNGSIQRFEPSYGSGFLSQSSRFLTVEPDLQLIEIMDSKGNVRVINF